MAHDPPPAPMCLGQSLQAARPPDPPSEAASAPVPDPDGLYTHVYAPGWQEQFERFDQAGPFGEREGTKQWRR